MQKALKKQSALAFSREGSMKKFMNRLLDTGKNVLNGGKKAVVATSLVFTLLTEPVVLTAQWYESRKTSNVQFNEADFSYRYYKTRQETESDPKRSMINATGSFRFNDPSDAVGIGAAFATRLNLQPDPGLPNYAIIGPQLEFTSENVGVRLGLMYGSGLAYYASLKLNAKTFCIEPYGMYNGADRRSYWANDEYGKRRLVEVVGRDGAFSLFGSYGANMYIPLNDDLAVLGGISSVAGGANDGSQLGLMLGLMNKIGQDRFWGSDIYWGFRFTYCGDNAGLHVFISQPF